MVSKKVVLIGWDGADWNIINPMLDAGKMPNLEKLVNQGVIGNLATLYPELSPMLWTSIATGKRPFKHGVLGFTEPDPHRGGIRPITNLSRTTKAVWNILSQNGKKCNVIGWWPSHPVEPINGVMVSNHFQSAVGPIDKPWPIQPGTIHPQRLTRNLAELRWHPQSLNERHILPFVPNAGKVDQDKDKRLESIAKIICECSSVNAVTRAIMHHEPWDFTAVYLDAIDHFSHGFMRFHPPRQDWISRKEFEIYSHVVESSYYYHDMMLGRLLEETDEDTTVIIISDHGFVSDHLRRKHVPIEPAGPAAQHRHYGIFVMKGPGIKQDERVYGANLLDICPTVLTLFGLPVGRDMDGSPVVNAFESPQDIQDIEVIPTWDQVKGDAGMHHPDLKGDPVEAQEAINQLVALGYIEKPDDDQEKAAAKTVRELHYNLARSYMDAGFFANGAVLLEDLLERWPGEYRFGIQLVSCYQALDRNLEARKVLDNILKQKQENALKARGEFKEFTKKYKDTNPEDLSEKEIDELRRIQSEASFNPFSVEYLMGSVLFGTGDHERALEHLKNAEKIDASQPGIYIKIGDLYLKLKMPEDAGRCFRKALDLDPDNAQGHLGLCRTYLLVRSNKNAAKEALKTVGLIYHNPMAHYLLGIALHRLGRIPDAVKALELSVSQSPNFPEAYRRLAYIYKHRLRDPVKVTRYRKMANKAGKRLREIKKAKSMISKHEILEQLRVSGESPQISHEPLVTSFDFLPPEDLNEVITIVSGLPRSGTSMMMQMLKAGGLEPLTDERRKADKNNPLGYFEFEPVKQLQKDRSWIIDSKGKCVKIISQLLSYLPKGEDHNFRIVFMERDLDEVVASQQKMLDRTKKQGADMSRSRIKEVFSSQVSRVKKMLAVMNIPVLYVNHRKCIEDPSQIAEKVNSFFGKHLEESKMVSAISPNLYRERINPHSS